MAVFPFVIIKEKKLMEIENQLSVFSVNSFEVGYLSKN
jgi:hypothetical protein